MLNFLALVKIFFRFRSTYLDISKSQSFLPGYASTMLFQVVFFCFRRFLYFATLREQIRETEAISESKMGP